MNPFSAQHRYINQSIDLMAMAQSYPAQYNHTHHCGIDKNRSDGTMLG
jgi:hypothetical protein